ncbi:MAG: 30S ribosomal protein S15 [Flavobacteriaceae bacterium]|nr:30S ribosomal protein S15 [Flavobacteriaceae bacterium]MCY4268206.1 30S ribosomal protein S15 [Flavobacteriaceae bacterium]MCY4300079.1 30S ribosomal protein S15 [Flavobacteriaceae bacterium]
MTLTKEEKSKIYNTFGGSQSNTGVSEVQIALMTERIKHLSKHLKNNHKDHNTKRSLIKLVGKRRRLLNYLISVDIMRYRTIIKKLNLRK